MESFDLERLAGYDKIPCVSLFLETHPTGRQGEQDAIRLKNLLREAEHQLAKRWMRWVDARALIQQVAFLPSDDTFWSKRKKGLAVFVAPEFSEAHHVPMALADNAFVANRFRVRPLLPLLENRRQFFLLTISENQVALYSADDGSITRMEVPALPANLQQALNYDGADRGSQVHSSMHGRVGKQAAVFHGQGGQQDRMKDDLTVYCSQVDKAVAARLGKSNRPLLIACVDPLAAIYRRVNSYPHLLEETFAGNHDYENEHQLHEASLRIVEPSMQAESEKVAVQYQECLGTQRACDDVREVVSAAIHGRVRSLLYNPTAEVYGQSDPVGDNVTMTGNAEDDDLVDLSVLQTLRQGGSVHSMAKLQIPTNAPLAALLRF